jgi:hypothetical protein
VCESTCHECCAKDEVENYKEDSVVEKADLTIKKDSEHKKNNKTKRKPKILESTV